MKLHILILFILVFSVSAFGQVIDDSSMPIEQRIAALAIQKIGAQSRRAILLTRYRADSPEVKSEEATIAKLDQALTELMTERDIIQDYKQDKWIILPPNSSILFNPSKVTRDNEFTYVWAKEIGTKSNNSNATKGLETYRLVKFKIKCSSEEATFVESNYYTNDRLDRVTPHDSFFSKAPEKSASYLLIKSACQIADLKERETGKR